jgi:hypothetical protein
MAAAAQGCAVPDATERLARMVERLAEGRITEGGA